MIIRIIRIATVAVLLAVASFGSPIASSAEAAILAKIKLSAQRMEVYIDGVKRYTWRVSTGKKGWETKPGSYTPFALTPYFYSKKWKMSLPYLVSIGADGTAIHGTSYASKLGSPASHGCIRLATGNARIFYQLIEAHGMWSTTVEITR